MAVWTSGYVADIGYTYGYYPELNPSRIGLAFLNQGLVFPEVGTACELGFGQGMSVNLHAAASKVSWWGTDFNPSQAGFARELSAISGSRAQLFDQSFQEFCIRPELPDFDFIGLHGIWSWISDDTRSVIVDFIRRKLRVGGVLYVSYNTLPGWAAFSPMRHLMVEHAKVFGAEGNGIISRIEGSINFAEKLLATNPIYSRANSLVSERFKTIKGHNRNYLAHEYFNRDWQPMYFSAMEKWLEPAKVQYACSAHYLDLVDTVNLTTEQQEFLKEIQDPVFRQLTRDFIVNQQFRKDYWVKGARTLSWLEQRNRFREQRLILTSQRQDVSLKVMGALGEASLQESVYAPILDILADQTIRTLGELELEVKSKNIAFGQLTQAIVILIAAGHLSPALDQKISETLETSCNAVNDYLRTKSRDSNELEYLASPVTGGGIRVSRFHQLFMESLAAGKREPGDWGNYAWNILESQGQRVIKDGKTLESSAENLAELTVQAKKFQQTSLSVFKSLRIV